MFKIMKRFIIILMLVVLLISAFSNIARATEISYATVKNGGDCGFHLQFWDTNQNAWSYIITHYAYYEEAGKQYPAYCLDKDLAGVGTGDLNSYDVNVNQVMDDERLWRVAINGYPYQSPEAMGVANYQDAFVATKQAVYCIIYGFDPNTRYNGGDSRGVAIKNAIINLVNIGRYGTQTRSNTNITTSKVGVFYEDGDYYSQEYLVNSPVETSQYTITATNGLPEGSQITNMSNNSQTAFNGNEHFKVRIPKSKLNQDINAVISIQAKCKIYPVFYGSTTIPGTQNYMLTFEPYGDATISATLNEKIQGQIRIVKTSEDDNFINGNEKGSPISNVKFEVYDSNKNKVDEMITNKEGIAITKKLNKGNYTIKEVESGEWYLLNENEFSAEIEYHEEITNMSITNKSEKPDVDIEKTGIIQTTAKQEIKYNFKIKNTGNVPLSNFTWYDYLPTDYVRITKLVTGTYNRDLNYAVYYKTNKNGYRLLKDNLNTQVNNYIDLSDLGLESDEYITEFKVDFGTVDAGFESVINPYIFVRVNSNVKNDDTFTNKTRIEGNNKTYMVWDEDEHTTKVYEKEIKVKKLPKTGL